jgi:glycosyltransferase involved in cell wall biosynthesis
MRVEMSSSNFNMRIIGYNTSPVVRCFVAVARLFGFLLPFRSDSSLFFFFPFCHVGGAEKVHAEIVSCFKDEKPWVFFTKKSRDQRFLSQFGNRARLFNIWHLLKYGYPLSVGVMAGFVNRHKNPVVFGSNSLFYYLLLPYLRPEVKCVDLLHAFGGGSECFSLPDAPRLDARVVINGKTRYDLTEQYKAHGLPSVLGDRVVLIENRVEVPEAYPAKQQHEKLKVLYVGRGSEEKRVHLVGRIAARCCRRGLPAEFLLVGDTISTVAAEDRPYCTFAGELADRAELRTLYADADLLLLTSSREGFPMVIMEAMAHGTVPLTTDVGGISDHVRDGITGWLVGNAADEGRVIDSVCTIIERICTDRAILDGMSRTAYEYARSHFGGERFCTGWRDVLNYSSQKDANG